MVSLVQLAVPVIVIWALWFSFVSNKSWIQINPIERKSHTLHPSQGAYGGAKLKEQRYYIIAGGSGFIGSWIVRYLLARGEAAVHILDIERPPADVMKRNVEFTQVNLTHPIMLEREMARIADMIPETTSVIVYNCSLVKRISLPNVRLDLGVHAAETLYLSLSLFGQDQVTLIHVGHTLASRTAIINWDRIWPTKDVWCQVSSPDTDVGFGIDAESPEERKDTAFSSYAWQQRQVEVMTLRASTYSAAVKASAVLRIEGFASGHLGDGFLSPIFQRKFLFLHSSKVPISIVNIEDVARGCLSLEHRLMDPSTQKNVNGGQFTVSSNEITNMENVIAYCRDKEQSLYVLKLPPALVFLTTFLLSIVYGGTPLAHRSVHDSPLNITLKWLTFSRFYSLQVGQLPNADNFKRQHEVLGLRNNFSLSQTLDSLMQEVALVEKDQKKERNPLTRSI